MRNLVLLLIAGATIVPEQAMAQRYFARTKLQPVQYSGSWSTQTSAPYCSGPERKVDVVQTCTSGSCDPNAMQPKTSQVVGSCSATCGPIRNNMGWQLSPTENSERHSLGKVEYTTGWEARMIALCEADPLPHVGCYAYGGSKIDATPAQNKPVLAYEGGRPFLDNVATDVTTTCTWK